MIASILLLSLIFGRAAAENCTGLVFFGEDRNPDDGKNDVLPLESTPNATAAQVLFFMGITDAATEDLEDLTVGDTSPTLIFPNSTINATLTGGDIRSDPPVNGQYAISPVNYFSTDDDFTLTFSTNVSALGFFGADIGDVEGVLTAVFIRPDGTNCTLFIPHEVDGPSGGVLYLGYIDILNPFVEVQFTNSEGKRDRFAFDDFTIAIREVITASAVPTPEETSMPTPDELCAEGITNADETVCCDGDCISCGGCECDKDPLGAALCCPGVIADTEFVCMVSSDVACLLGEYIPSEEGQCMDIW